MGILSYFSIVLGYVNWASFRRSSHFFISGNNPIAKLPEYLETMLGKMAKEMPGINSKQEVLGSQDEEVTFSTKFLDGNDTCCSDEYG